MIVDVVDGFFDAINRGDLESLAGCIHPSFEMVVPQRPARGFVGADQEVANIRNLCARHPDLQVTVLRKTVDGAEVWTESELRAQGLEMMAVVIWTVDEGTRTLRGGRYYSEVVQHDAADIDQFIGSL